ncbi:Epimerase/hydratase [Tolypocladium paradoxum]|uniref:Epimerase/hydratase n=1 Tax=Tolypocladium paradoxum TaxID=94208 RepID=A0A2S4KTM3_9HYPO|nr:Epimerase/hydratase [Tolypocladium paradoxum]
MATSHIAFIIGGGPRIGHAVAKKFLGEGYKVAIGRRNVKESAEAADLQGATTVAVDVSKPESVEQAFGEVEAKLGIPNVVVYNGEPSFQGALIRDSASSAAALTVPPEQGDPFSVPPAAFAADSVVNATSGYAALHHATRGWKKLRESSPGSNVPTVFIVTGNVTPFRPIAMATTLGPGKSALAHLLQIAAQEYRDAGDRFYFASQVTDAGGPVANVDVRGDAHAEVYWGIVRGEVGRDTWDVRFAVASDGAVSYKKGLACRVLVHNVKRHVAPTANDQNDNTVLAKARHQLRQAPVVAQRRADAARQFDEKALLVGEPSTGRYGLRIGQHDGRDGVSQGVLERLLAHRAGAEARREACDGGQRHQRFLGDGLG